MLVIVVGASGSGKDSLLGRAREAFSARSDIHFQRRMITREPDDAHEPHDSVDVATFERLRREGALLVHWQAHGLHYGVPRTCLVPLREGRVVVVNGSRQALPRFADVFPRRRIVHVSVPPPILEARLRARGRENEAAIQRRLARQVETSHLNATDRDRVCDRVCDRVWLLDNSGALDTAAQRFTGWLESLMQDLPAQATPPRLAPTP